MKISNEIWNEITEAKNGAIWNNEDKAESLNNQ